MVRKLSTVVNIPAGEQIANTTSDWLNGIRVRFIINPQVHTSTFELIPGVKDTHVCWDGVEPTTSYDVHTFFSCLTVVI